MRYAVCFEIEAESADEAAGAIANINAILVSVSEASCPSISQFKLARMWECGSHIEDAVTAAYYVDSHWEHRCEENPLHSKLRLCHWCGTIKKESDTQLIDDLYDDSGVPFRQVHKWRYFCNQCLQSVIHYKTEMSGVSRAKSLLSRIRGNPDRSVKWDSIEKEYRFGTRSLRKIGSEFGVTEGAIRKRAIRDGWLRTAGGANVSHKNNDTYSEQTTASEDLCKFLEQILSDLRCGLINKEKSRQIAIFADISVDILSNEIKLNALTRR